MAVPVNKVPSQSRPPSASASPRAMPVTSITAAAPSTAIPTTSPITPSTSPTSVPGTKLDLIPAGGQVERRLFAQCCQIVEDPPGRLRPCRVARVGAVGFWPVSFRSVGFRRGACPGGGISEAIAGIELLHGTDSCCPR